MPYKDPAAKRAASYRARAKAAAAGKDYAKGNSYDRRRKRRHAEREASGEAPRMPIFVALDGEGTNQPDGDQWYTLLVAYTAQGNIGDRFEDRKVRRVENYERGLSTLECLNFLLDIGRDHRQTYVAFYFNYDVTKMLHDLSPEELSALWKANWLVWEAPNHRLYYLKWIPTKFFEVGLIASHDGVDLEDLNPRKDCEKLITIYDTSGFFQTSFVSALEKWNVATAEDLAEITDMKGRRNDFTTAEKQRIYQYCAKECKYLCVLMNQLAQALWDAELYLTDWHGAGAIANTLFAKYNVADHLENPPDEVEEAILGAYFGGRIELFRQGYFTEEVVDYDLQSAYPSAAITLPSLKGGTWTHISSPTMDMVQSTSHALWRLSWDVTDKIPRSRSKRSIPGLAGPLPFRWKGRISFPFQAGPTWVHAEELQTAISIFGAEKFTLHEGWLFTPATSDLPFGFLEQVAAERIQAKKAGQMKHIPLKLGMNSVYGKLAQGQTDPTRQPKYLSYYLAGRITARTRAKLLAAAVAAGDGLVAIATDGLFTTNPVAGLPFGNTPGSWELAESTAEAMLFLQPGIIFSESGQVRKTRGFSKKSLSYRDSEVEYVDGRVPSSALPPNLSERERAKWLRDAAERGSYTLPGLKTLWLRDGTYGGATYFERRFVGIGSTVGTGHWQELGRWIERERKLNFYIGGNKFYYGDDPSNPYERGVGYVLPPERDGGRREHIERVVPPDYSGIECEPYIKPHLLEEQGSRELLALIAANRAREIERQEQPDWYGRAMIEEQL